MRAVVNYKYQQGAVLLMILLVLVSAASYTLVSKLNKAAKTYNREKITSSALAEAKQALISYAVTYPDRVNANSGPGYLPCPDRDNDGRTDPGSCASGTGTTIGRFPWFTLKSNDLRDGSGQHLWYALSDNYRNNPQLEPLNSDTAGQLTLDGVGDIVALVIAPGEPLANQNRNILEFNIANEIANYLEGENADIGAAYDVDFATTDAGDFNDRVIEITRQELMSLVEKRVLGDVTNAINNYQTNYSAYPWLSPFADSSTSAFRGAVNTVQGYLPFHWSADPDSINQGGGIAGRNPFTTNISLSWSINNSNTNIVPAGNTFYEADDSGYEAFNGNMQTPDLNCVINSTCADPNYVALSIAAPIVFDNASCTWSNREVFQCTGTFVNTIVNNSPQQLVPDASFTRNSGPNEKLFLRDAGVYVYGEGGPYCLCWQTNVHTQYAYEETITRTYIIDITYTDTSDNGADINFPTNLSVRTRDLSIDSNDVADALFSTGTAVISISVVDDRTVVVDVPAADGPDLTFTTTATHTLVNDVATTGSITATGITYDIDIDGFDGRDDNGDGDFDDIPRDIQPVSPELASWLITNEWQNLIYTAYASGEPLPGNTVVGQDCVSLATTCITVTNDNGVTNNVRAVTVSSGADIVGFARPNGTLTNYLENENSNPVDDSFIQSRLSNIYNDQTRIISTAP